MNLKSKAATGFFWSAITTFSIQGIGLSITLILARILTPSDYGIVGILGIFFSFTQMFIESGFGNALIQKSDRTEIDFNTVLYFNFFISVLLYLLLFICAPLISNYFKIPELVLITRVLSLNIIISSLNIVQQVKCNINLDFKTPAFINIFSLLASGFAGITLAINGFGVWALVFQSIISSVSRTTLFIIFSKWKTKFEFSMNSLKRLFSFSSNILIAGILATSVNNLYSIYIGRMFSTKDLGYYSQSKQLPELLSNTIMTILQSVTFPILSSLQNNRNQMILVYSKIMRMTFFLVLPVLTLFALLTEPFVRIVLTEKWISVVPLMQWLCFARMFTPISSLNMNILNAIGRSDLFLKLDLLKLPITITTLLVTLPFGLKAVVIGHFATSCISFFINAYYPGKIFKYGAFKQLNESKYNFVATLIMASLVYFIRHFVENDVVYLFLGAVIGSISYLYISFILNVEELKEFNYLFIKIKNKINYNI